AGNVAGRDVVVGASPVDAAAAQDRQQVLALLGRLQEEVAALQDAPKGPQRDAQDDLGKAREAGEEGDTERLVEKLESAHGYLERIAQTAPAAVTLAQTVATLFQRVLGPG